MNFATKQAAGPAQPFASHIVLAVLWLGEWGYWGGKEDGDEPLHAIGPHQSYSLLPSGGHCVLSDILSDISSWHIFLTYLSDVFFWHCVWHSLDILFCQFFWHSFGIQCLRDWGQNAGLHRRAVAAWVALASAILTRALPSWGVVSSSCSIKESPRKCRLQRTGTHPNRKSFNEHMRN